MVGYKFNYIGNGAVKYSAKIINFHSADSAAFFHTVNGSTADTVLIYECMGRNIFLFDCFPKGFIANNYAPTPFYIIYLA